MTTLFNTLSENSLDNLFKWGILSYQDYLVLSLVEPKLRQIQYPIASQIKAFLSVRMSNPELANKLLETVKLYGAMLSGSMILGIVYKTCWADADLDIFVPVTTSPFKYTPLDRLLQPFRVKDQSTDDINYKKYGQFYRGSEKFVSIRQYEIPVEGNFPLSIQLINVANAPSDTPEEGIDHVKAFISSEFDFDFCKIAFDGENIWFAGEARKALANKSCAPNYIIPETLRRMEKYINRGFRFIGIKEYLGFKHREAFFKKKKGRLVDIQI